MLAGNGVVVHHGIHVASGHQKAQPGTTEAGHILRSIKTGLGQYRHTVALAFQQAGDDGRAKAGVIHIGIAGDIDKVRGLPAAGRHFFFCDGQKAHSCSLHFLGSVCWSSLIRGRLQR